MTYLIGIIFISASLQKNVCMPYCSLSFLLELVDDRVVLSGRTCEEHEELDF